MIEWMHNEMNICHLDLTMDNIMVKDGDFIENKQDNSITINPKASIRICDFGLAEGFDVQKNKFQCAKHEISDYMTLKSPQVYNEGMFY